MPSTTRGSILISTANDIGEALVEKLGGVGYSPNEWKDKINLCGIAPIDSAPALSVLSDSAGTGDARGSILIATADAIGAILNKKYNVLRGFKPKEWASACRKMKALEDGSVASASIASFSDGADTVPLTSCVCSIDANLDGKTAVVCKHTGETVFFPMDIEQGSISESGYNSDSSARVRTAERKAVSPSTQYKIKVNSEVQIYEVHEYTDLTGSSTHLTVNASEYTFTTKSTTNYLKILFRYSNNATITPSAITELQVTSGALEWETKTADLGRAVYGGSADIIKGEGVNEYEILTLAVADMNNSENYPGWRNCGVREIIGAEVSSSVTNGVSTVGQYWSYNTLGSNDILYLPRGQYNNMTQSDWINTYPDLVIQFVIQKATPENFTFEPVKIDSFPGVNNIWNDCGDTAVEYYKAPTPYARKTATGGIANFSDQRTDLPLTKAIANIAPSIAGKSAVNLYQGSEQYQPTTTYTAELGETVYGGSVDFVSGEVVKDCTKDSMSSSYLSGLSLDTYIGYEASTAYFGGHPSVWVRNWNYQTAAARTSGGIKCACDEFPASMNNTTIFSAQYRIYFDVNGKNISSVQDFIDYVENLEQNGKQLEITYEIATPTESTIPGRVISPIEGVNNYWNDAGGDTEIQYFEDET